MLDSIVIARTARSKSRVYAFTTSFLPLPELELGGEDSLKSPRLLDVAVELPLRMPTNSE